MPNIKRNGITLNDVDSPVWLGIRQQEMESEISACVTLAKWSKGARVGLTAFYNDSYHYEIYLTEENGKNQVCLAKHVHDIFAVTEKVEIPTAANVTLRIEADSRNYRFYYGLQGKADILLGTGMTAGLCTEGTHTMTFTGTYLGMFAERTEGIFRKFLYCG